MNWLQNNIKKSQTNVLYEELMSGMFAYIVLVKVTCLTLYTMLNTIMNRKAYKTRNDVTKENLILLEYDVTIPLFWPLKSCACENHHVRSSILKARNIMLVNRIESMFEQFRRIPENMPPNDTHC